MNMNMNMNSEDEPKRDEIRIQVPPVLDADLDEDDMNDIRVERVNRAKKSHVDRGGFRGT